MKLRGLRKCNAHLSILTTFSIMAADAGPDILKQATGRNTRGLLRVIILALIAGAAVSSRLFSVIRFESIIHECQSSNAIIDGQLS